jgi:hypothetical protein
VSTQRIDALVNSGQLATNADGLIDREAAESIRQTMNPNRVGKEAEAKTLGGQKTTQQDASKPLVQARMMKEVYAAKRLELHFKRESGDVVAKADVRASTFEIGRLFQQRLLAFPARLGSELTTLMALPPDDVEPAIRRVLERECKALIKDITRGLAEVSDEPVTEETT